jgi:hypothetical protein
VLGFAAFVARGEAFAEENPAIFQENEASPTRA